MKDLTLIIPAKNEPESLPYVLIELEKLKLEFLIIMEERDFVTINAIDRFKSKIIFQKNRGYGDAILLGLQSIKTKYFLLSTIFYVFLLIEENKIKNKGSVDAEASAAGDDVYPLF